MIPMEWLTSGERAVYERRAAGKRNLEIAAELGITTVNVATTYIAACRRIKNGGPRAGKRRSQSDALWRFDQAARQERPCARCGLRGHVPGEPGRCLSIYALAASRSA